MQFADPRVLLLLVVVLPLAYLLWRPRRDSYTLPAGGGLWPLRPNLRTRTAALVPVLRLAAVAAMVVGLARPRVGDANAIIPAEGIDMVLALDISSSMLAGDFGGRNRLEATKAVVQDFIKGRENDRIGIVVFQEDALPLSPPSLDYEALDRLVADLESGLLPDGTGIGVGLASALNMLQSSSAASRIVIVLTDGEQNARSISPEDAAELAVALRIRVYTIAVIGRDSSSVDEERLIAIADRTGGRFFAADSPNALAEVYREISSLETSRVGSETYSSYSEHGPWIVGVGALLLLLDLALRATWLRRLPA